MSQDNQEPKKKKSSFKSKLIFAVIAVVVLVGFGIYLGMRFQAAYNRFIFNASQSIMTFAFWLVIILIVVLVIYIMYLVIKYKGKNKKDGN